MTKRCETQNEREHEAKRVDRVIEGKRNISVSVKIFQKTSVYILSATNEKM